MVRQRIWLFVGIFYPGYNHNNGDLGKGYSFVEKKLKHSTFFPQSGRILRNKCAVSFRFIDPDVD